MGYFKGRLHDEFGSWPLAYIPYGGATLDDVAAIATFIGDGDDSQFYQAWNASADRLVSAADLALANGGRSTAKALYLRASVYRATSYHPIYGAPVDPRLLASSRKQVAEFDKGLALCDPPIERQFIPFDDTPLPAYFVPAIGHEYEIRPLIIFNNGYDATIPDMYFASAVAASERGYHTLLFDGPGQGAMLVEHGVPLLADWDLVINAVVNFAVLHPLVDPKRIALSGWSLGGYLAPRGASGEHRIAALIADPGTWSIADGFRRALIEMFKLPADKVADLGEIDQVLLDRFESALSGNRELYWKIVQRGFWVHGVDNLRDYFRSVEWFTMQGRAELIRCPTLLTLAQDDPIAADVNVFFDALRCTKTLLRFNTAEGAGGHCEMGNRPLLNRRVLDWLDETL